MCAWFFFYVLYFSLYWQVFKTYVLFSIIFFLYYKFKEQLIQTYFSYWNSIMFPLLIFPLLKFKYMILRHLSIPARMYLHPYRPGRSPDGQCLLGVVLPGARHPARRTDAQWQDNRRRRWLLQHVLQWDGSRETRAKSRVCWFGTHCCR